MSSNTLAKRTHRMVRVKEGRLKRILLVLTVAAVMVAITAGSAMPSFAQLNLDDVLNLVNGLVGGLPVVGGLGL